MGYEPAARPRRGWRIAVKAGALGLIAATLLPILSTEDWWIRVLDFPRPHIAVLLALATPIAWAALKQEGVVRPALLAAMVAALGLQLARLWPYTPLHAVQAPMAATCAAEHDLSLVAANLQASRSDPARFLDAVRQADPDLIFAVEVDPRWVEELRPLEARYPHRLLHPRDDFWGFALYSRLPLAEPRVLHRLTNYVPSLEAGLRLPTGEVIAFHGLHPKPPLPSQGTGQRDAELLLAAQAISEAGRPALLAGDLNAVAWSATTALVQRIGGLMDPRIGRGPFATFPAWLPAALRVPIDHVFFTPEFSLISLERLPEIGSDHLPILARLCRVPGQAARRGAAPPAGEADRRRAREAIRDGLEDAPHRLPRD
jgi:endonuclease/exonuclease/phosphatase (EEP) superfamily protein YafD